MGFLNTLRMCNRLRCNLLLLGLLFFLIVLVHPVHAAAPVLTKVGSLSFTGAYQDVKDVVILGNTVFEAFHNTGTFALRAFDVADPANPHIVGGDNLTLSAMDQPTGMAGSGHYLYISKEVNQGAQGNIVTVDVIDPTTPVVVGVPVLLTNGNPTSNMVLVGHYLYLGVTSAIVNGSHGYFEVVDVSNPLAPVSAGSLSLVDPLDQNSNITVSGSYAYVLMSHPGGATVDLKVIDISNPAAPTLTTTVTGLPAGQSDFTRKIQAISSSSLLYTYVPAGQNTTIFRTIDISNPLSPVVSGDTDLSFSSTIIVGGYGGLMGSYLPFSGVDMSTIGFSVYTVDFTTPSQPGQAQVGASAGSGVMYGNFRTSGNYLYASGITLSPDFQSQTGLVLDVYSIATQVVGGGGSRFADFIPPDAPTKVEGASDGTKVTLTWHDPIAQDLVAVEVLRNSGGNTPVDGGTIVASAAKGVQRFEDTDVRPGVTYTYVLRSRDTSRNIAVTEEFKVLVEKVFAISPSTETVKPITPPTPVLVQPPVPPVGLPVVLSDEEVITQGTPGTLVWSQKDRAAFLRDFQDVYPGQVFDLRGVAKFDGLATSEIIERNVVYEKNELKKVAPYVKKLVAGNKAWQKTSASERLTDFVVYRLKASRDLGREKTALGVFQKIFKHIPKDAREWQVVRALAYFK